VWRKILAALWLDLVLARNTGKVEILRNLGNGKFARTGKVTRIADPQFAKTIAIAAP
jgi:hypothetical protein